MPEVTATIDLDDPPMERQLLPKPNHVDCWLVVLTDVRPLTNDADRRNEQRAPERRWRVIRADSLQAAELLWHAFTSLGMVRSGRRRVKVVAAGGTRRAVAPSAGGR